MANKNTQPSADEYIGSYESAEGVTISIPSGQALEYSKIKADQLQALTWMIVNEQIGAGTHEALKMHEIVKGLAHEVEQLLPIVHADALKGGA